MQARVLRVNGARDKVDEGIEAYKSRVAPDVRERDGYGGARLIVDRNTGAAMSITFWRDAETSRASFDAMTSVRAEATSSFGAATPEAKMYEAVVQHRSKPTEAGNWVRVTTLAGDPTKGDEGIRHFEYGSSPRCRSCRDSGEPSFCSTARRERQWPSRSGTASATSKPARAKRVLFVPRRQT